MTETLNNSNASPGLWRETDVWAIVEELQIIFGNITMCIGILRLQDIQGEVSQRLREEITKWWERKDVLLAQLQQTDRAIYEQYKESDPIQSLERILQQYEINKIRTSVRKKTTDSLE